MLTWTATQAIVGYQRFISPYKGFCCAYHHQTGRHSCSEYARRLVARRGAVALLQGLPRQFARCKTAYAVFLAQQQAQDQEERSGQRKRRWWEYCDCAPWDPPLPKKCDGPGDCDIVPCDCSP
jgi:uncharacterized protein